MLRSIGKQSGGSEESVLKKEKEGYGRRGFAEKEGFKPAMKEWGWWMMRVVSRWNRRKKCQPLVGLGESELERLWLAPWIPRVRWFDLLFIFFHQSTSRKRYSFTRKTQFKNRFKNVWIKWPTRVKIASFISYLIPSFMPLTVIRLLVIISFP